NGNTNQTIAGGSSTTFNGLTIANTGDPNIPNNVVSLDGSAGANNTAAATLTVINGVFDQGSDSASSNLSLTGAGDVATITLNGTWQNFGTGDITLNGDVSNNGSLEIDANARPCGQSDDILIRSSASGTQRTWKGTGTFSMTDVDVQDQKVPGGSTLPLAILVASGTDHPATNIGWRFNDSCTGPYTWLGGGNRRWIKPACWSPTRESAADLVTEDVLIFDGSVDPAPFVDEVPNQTNAAIHLTNGVHVTFEEPELLEATLTLNGASGEDLDVPAGTVLTLAGSLPFVIELTAPGHQCEVAGQIIMKDDRHQFIGANAGQITITGRVTIDSTYSAIEHPFGQGTNGSVVFESGSTGMFSRGLDPFGGIGRAVVTFNAGSTAHFLSNGAFFGQTGATYGNLILDGTQGYTFAGSTQTTILNNLEIQPGSTFLLSNSPGADLNLYGNFVDRTAIANGFSTNGRVVKFLGTTQTVSKAEGGIVSLDDVFINQSPGGKVQLLSPTDIAGQLNLSTADALLELNGQVVELLGTVTGPGNLKGDPNAIIAVNGAGALGTVNFASGGRTLLGLLLNREVNGSMTLGTDLAVAGTLRLDDGKLITANTLSLSSISSVLRTNGYVLGNVQKSFGESGIGTFTFPVGTANAYSPLDANVTANTNGTLTARAVEGTQPNIPGGTNALQRYWTLSGSGITADLTFHYSTSPTNDVVGNEANYKIFKYDGAFTQFTPDATGSNSASDHFATLNNVSSFSDWTLAEAPTIIVGNDDSYSTNEDTSLNVAAPGVLTNDTGDTLTASLDTGPSHALSFQLNVDGSFDYTPAADYNGQDSFIYTIHDAQAGTANAIVTITIDPVNDAPTFQITSDPPAVNEDVDAQTFDNFATNFQPGPATATAEAGQTLHGYAITANGSTGGLTFSSGPAIDNAGTLTYTPAANANGTATFNVVATDSGSGLPPDVNQSVPVSFMITVTPQNDSPTLANNAGLLVANGGTETINQIRLKVDDVDNTAAELVYTIGTAPVNGTLKNNGVDLLAGGTFTQADINDNQIAYQHNGSAALTDSFTFTVADGAGGSIGSTTFNITIGCSDNITVTSIADSGNGTLREALGGICAGGTITFDTAGTFSTPQTIILSSELTIGLNPGLENVTIDGPDPATQRVTIAGGGGSRLFRTQSGKTATIRDLTLTGGSVAGDFGGAIYNDHATLTLSGLTVSGNTADFGGAIYNNGGPPNGDGAATLTIVNSTISGNTASVGGGAIYTSSSGANLNGATVNITNSTLSGNNSAGNGGGVFSDGISGITPVSITNSTITDNRADTGNGGSSTGGGLFIVGGTEVTLRNSIVDLNFAGSGTTANDIRGAVVAGGVSTHNLIGSCSLPCGLTNGVDNNSLNVSAASLNIGALLPNGAINWTHALLPGSVAVEAGNDVTTLNGDITDVAPLINLTNATAFPAGVGFPIRIDDEQMIVTDKAGNVLTVIRGANGTTAASHSVGAGVNPAFDGRGSGFIRQADSADADAIATVDIGAFELQPSIEDIGNQTTNEDTQFNLTFNIGDGALISGVTATSDNQTLAPDGNITVDGTGSTRTIHITPTATLSGGPVTITVTVTATNGGTAQDTFELTITPVNDGPVNTVPGPQVTSLNIPLVFSSANGNQVSVADLDAGTNAIQVTLNATNGTLTLSGTTGLSFSFSDSNGIGTGDGTADETMTFRGPITNINDALNGTSFEPTPGFSGDVTVQIISNDLGFTGAGDVLTDVDSISATVAPTVSVVSVQDAQAAEPASGTADLLFTVTLISPAPAGGASVQYASADQAPAPDHAVGGATCGSPGVDYEAKAPTTLSFAAGEQFKTVSVRVCSDALASESTETFLLNLSNPMDATISDGAATGSITVTDTSGTLLISELRTSGPGGADDDFVELYNNSNSPVDISGYGLFKMGATCVDQPVLIATIPNTPTPTVIPARGHYLLVGSAYSLTNYGGTGSATGNLTLTAGIETDRNIALFSTANLAAISTVNRLDAVGFGVNTGGACNLLREASTLPPIAGNATIEHSYFRKMCDWLQGQGCTVPGIPKDTNNNANDFWLADTAGSAITGRLGAPGPENLASPIRRDNAGINMVVLDGTVGASAAPNRDRNSGDPAGLFGSMKLRYRVTNNTGGPVTRLRYRIVDMSTAIQPVGPTADLRALTSSVESVGQVNDTVTCTADGAGAPSCTVTVTATTLETPPNQAIGGGYNSTLSSGTITTGTPLPNGQSILIHFKLGVQKTGTFRFYIIVEALP
ncbi:MAG TPA: cadherin-like domain-containing protein, partial [Pyrinomonadaceae bacterium]